MSVKVTFSPYCIGENRDQYKQKKCKCERCLKASGDEVNELTILQSKIESYIYTYHIGQSITNVTSKSMDMDACIKDTLFDIRNLIRNLNGVLDDYNSENKK